MIHFTDTSCDLDILDAQALLEFASTDKMREHLGVGISNGDLCATDGHTLLRFNLDHFTARECRPGNTQAPDNLNGKVWPHAYVKQQVAVAKATKQPVRLMYSAFSGGTFPPVQQVVPEKGFGVDMPDAVGFNPEYVARLQKVCKALACKGAQLTSMRGELDPLRFDVTGEGEQSGRSATVVIMPMRI